MENLQLSTVEDRTFSVDASTVITIENLECDISGSSAHEASLGQAPKPAQIKA